MKERQILFVNSMRGHGKSYFFSAMRQFVKNWIIHMLENKNRYQPGVAKRNRSIRRRSRKACKK